MNLQRISSALSLKLLLRPMTKMTAFKEWSKSFPVIKSLPMYAFHTVSVAQSMYNNPVWFPMLGLLMLNLLLLLGILEIFGGPSSAEGTVRVAVREPQPWRIGRQGRVASHSLQIFIANLEKTEPRLVWALSWLLGSWCTCGVVIFRDVFAAAYSVLWLKLFLTIFLSGTYSEF